MLRFVLPWYGMLVLLLLSVLLVGIQSCVATDISKTGDVIWTGDCKPSGLNGSGDIEVDCHDSKGLATNGAITKAYVEAALAGETPATIPCTLFMERVFGRHFVDCTAPAETGREAE